MARAEKINYQKVILGIIAISGIIAIAVIAPNCLQLLKFLPHQKTKKKYYVNQVITRLMKDGLIKISTNHRGQKVARLTTAGKQKLKKHQLEDLKIEQPKKWDGKYRLIIFDIKEWKRSTRDKLRTWFEQLGLVRLQNSVWVYPYDCQEIIALLKANYRIGNEVLYIEANKIENDWWLRKKFNLA